MNNETNEKKIGQKQILANLMERTLEWRLCLHPEAINHLMVDLICRVRLESHLDT